jgi:lactate permease
MPLTPLNWFLAFLPVCIVVVLMLGLKWGGSRAGAIGWFAAAGIAAAHFGAGPELIAYTQVKGALLTLDVLYIVWTALLLFHVADEAGAVQVIGTHLPRLTADRTLQALLLGWLFASFLQGMGGFGVPVAVTAPLLVGLGFAPVQAVLMACIGHGWAVNFGSLATAFQTLMAVTGLPGEMLAPKAALRLGAACFFCGAIVAQISGGLRGLLRCLPVVAVLSLVMGSVQYLLATHGLWTLGSTGGSMAGLAAGIVVARLPFYRRAHPANPEPAARETPAGPGPALPPRSLPLALSAYAILVALAFATNLIPPLSAWLGRVHLSLEFPALVTRYGFTNPAGPGRSINLLGHPGAVLLASALAAYWIYHRAGYYRPGAVGRILTKTGRGAINSSLAIVAMVGMALTMSSAGMTSLLAEGLSQGLGKDVYPLVSPFIGALGAFITGSNNNSNVLFAVLQQRTAELLGLSVPLILGSQTAGGALGSIMAPAKVIVGCSTVGPGENESKVLGRVLIYGMIPIACVALLTWLLARA